MNEHNFGLRDRRQKRKERRIFEDKIQYLLKTEEQLLQSISARAPLPQVLNEICCALDCEIGSVVSLFSLSGHAARDLAPIAMNAALFGLFSFCSEDIVAENDECIGSLEMYCCVPRRPSAGEFQLIERAKCLASLAIKLDKEEAYRGNGAALSNGPMRGSVLEWPLSRS